jgi:hypothetical protein
MTSVNDILDRQVSSGSVSGAVALVARGEDVEVHAAGAGSTESGP